MMEQKREELFRDAEPAADGGTFRVVIGMIGFVALIAVGWIAMSLHELKDDLRSLQKDETRQVVILDAEIEALKKEAGEEFQSLKEALSRIWHQHKPAELEIMGFLASLDPEQRKSLLAALESLNGEEEPGFTGSASEPTAEPALVSPSKPVLVSPVRPPPEPPAESPEPPAESPEPPAESPEPPAESPEPPVESPEPPAESPEPPAESPAPPAESPAPPAESSAEGSIRFKEYRIQPGDSLSRIAQKHKVSAEALARANEITDPNRIRVGQVLRIPLD